MSVKRITIEPMIEPVSLAEAKLFLRLTDSNQDEVVAALIKAARSRCEQVTARSFINTTWTAYLDCWPSTVHLTPSQLGSVTSIKYLDTAEVLQTLATSEYRVDAISEPARVTPAYGKSWPSIHPVTNAIEIAYVVGYGAAASDVPEGIRAAIKILCSTWYEFREAVIAGTIVASVPLSVDSLLDPYRVVQFAGSLP